MKTSKKYESIIPKISLTYKSREEKKYKINSPDVAKEFFRKFFRKDSLISNSSFGCVFINNSLESIGSIKIDVTDQTKPYLDYKMILKQALKCNSTSILVGYYYKDQEISDIFEAFSDRLKNKAMKVDIKLLDSINIDFD